MPNEPKKKPVYKIEKRRGLPPPSKRGPKKGGWGIDECHREALLHLRNSGEYNSNYAVAITYTEIEIGKDHPKFETIYRRRMRKLSRFFPK